MPAISRKLSIRDPLGAEIGVAGAGPLLEMLSSAGEFVAGIREGTLLELLRDPGKAFRETRLDEATGGLTFDQDQRLTELAEDARLDYALKAGARGSLSLLREGGVMDGLAIPPGEVYSVCHLAAELEAGLSVPIALGHGVTLTPGLRSGGALDVRNCRRHPSSAAVRVIVCAALSGFRFPFNPQSVAELGEGESIVYRLEGRLAVSAEIGWGLKTNLLIDQLADLNRLSHDLRRASVFGGELDLGVRVAADAAAEFVHGVQDEFEFRVEKQRSGRIVFTVSKAREKTGEAGFEFTAGVVPHVGPNVQAQVNRYLAERLPGAVADRLPEWTPRLVQAVEDALVSRANLAFSAAYKTVERGEKLFEFEFDLAGSEARHAYLKAAQGDLTAALEAARSPDSGLRLLRTVTEQLDSRQLDVVLNLVGLFRFHSAEELLTRSRIETDEAGEVSIYHQSSYEAKSETSAGHLKTADFLLKAAWSRAGGQAPGDRDFDFSLRYVFSENDRFTSRQELADVLNLAVALGTIPEARKQAILEQPAEFRRALSWPIVGLLSPESTYGRSSVLVECSFTEAGLGSILEHADRDVWETYCRAFLVANPRSPAADWTQPAVRDKLAREGWAAYVNVSDSTERARRHAVVTEYNRAKLFADTLAGFRKAVRTGATDEALISQMPEAARAAKEFHFDRSAFLALQMLCRTEERKTRVVIQGVKINAVFPEP